MAITGRQIQDARSLLGMGRSVLGQKVGCVTTLNARRAEESEGEPRLSVDVTAVLRHILKTLGIEFTNDEGLGVRLKQGRHPARGAEWR